MKSYPTSTSVSPALTLTDEATLDAALEHVLATIPLDTQGIYSPQTIYSVLLWAASRHDTIEHTCHILEGVPSSNDIRFHLNKLDNMALLEEQVNEGLQGSLPERVVNHRHRLAIDLHLIPYYGAAEEAVLPYLYRSQAKAGTTTFFAYATVYAIRCHQRVTLAIHAIPRGETLVATLTYLLARLTPVRVKVECLYLDRGFYSVPVIRWLQALRLPFIMPAIIRGTHGGTRALCQGRCSYQTPYTLRSQDYGTVNCQIAIVCRYRKGTRHQHGIQYLLFVVYRVNVATQHLPRHYRARFGIEASYRIKNACRIRTTTRHPVVRLLFVALAFILVNIWIWLLWSRLSLTRRGGRRVYQEYFRLKTMLEFLRHAIERQFPLIHVVSIPASG